MGDVGNDMIFEYVPLVCSKGAGGIDMHSFLEGEDLGADYSRPPGQEKTDISRINNGRLGLK